MTTIKTHNLNTGAQTGTRPTTSRAANQEAIAAGKKYLTAHTVHQVEHAEWRKRLQEFPAHSVFHTLPWLETLEAVYGASLTLMKTERNGKCTAIWPVQATRKGLVRVAGSPLPKSNTAYLGPLFRSPDDVHGALKAFLNDPTFKSAYFACKVLNTRHKIDLSRHGFRQVLKFDTYCVDLSQTEEQLWSNLKSECRTQIRKARKLGIEVRPEKSAQFLDEYWQMALDTFKYQRVRPLFTRQFLEEMWDRLYPARHVLGLSAWYEGERIASLMLPMDHHTMYYWSGVSYTRLRKLPAHNVLHWEAIRQAKRRQLLHYDFVSTLGNAGRFKRTFGPKTVTIATHWERCSSKLMQVVKDQCEKLMMKRRQMAA